ncbi:uncharacterized protein [Littorina saxatilis]|uniref:uncharacterized protein n=1 Tax=Littorina saxatilis TaxID=31220 RepID=UPI0038B5635E
MAPYVTSSIQTCLVKAVTLVVVLSFGHSETVSLGKRHAYISSIPFRNMKLAAPVVTSLPNASLRFCGVECLHNPQCQSFNYRSASRSCDLLGTYLCSGTKDLVYAYGIKYYDVEKNADVENLTTARADVKCRTDAVCSPKCTCTVVAFSSFIGDYLTPDDAVLAGVPESTTRDKCMELCATKPLPECRGINVNSDGSQCQHLDFLPSERPGNRYTSISGWDYHLRRCM